MLQRTTKAAAAARPGPRPGPNRPAASRYRQNKQERRRGEIMDAAAAVFAEKGYHAATTRDIADRLGMRPGSLYYYFDSKEAALEEVCRVGSDEFSANLDAILAAGGAPADMVRAGIAKHLRGEKQTYVTCFVHNRRFLPAMVVAEMNRHAKRYVAQWEEVFRRGRKAGAFPATLDPHLAAFAVIALCNGAVPNLEPKNEREIAAFVDALTSVFLDGALKR
jgi:AcrR family transcriptional regulator